MAKGSKYCKHNKLLSVRADLNTRWPVVRLEVKMYAQPVAILEIKMDVTNWCYQLASPTGVTNWCYHLGLPSGVTS